MQMILEKCQHGVHSFFSADKIRHQNKLQKCMRKRTCGGEGSAGRETDKSMNELESPEINSSLFRNPLIKMIFHIIGERINPCATLRQLNGHLNNELQSMPSTLCQNKFQINQNLIGENESMKVVKQNINDLKNNMKGEGIFKNDTKLWKVK